MNCKPGDLAICINTELPENNGLLVRVIRRHQNDETWNFGDAPTWWCTSDSPMTWNFRHLGELYRANQGPVPDALLRPLRPPHDKEIQREEELIAA